MWLQNHTQQFVQENFTEQDHAFVRREARKLDASGAAQKIPAAQNPALVERVETNRVRHARAKEWGFANKQRLAKVRVLKTATDEELSRLRISWTNKLTSYKKQKRRYLSRANSETRRLK